MAVRALLDVESRLPPVGVDALPAFGGVELDPGAEPDDMIAIRIRLEEHRVMTSYRRGLLILIVLFEVVFFRLRTWF